MRQVIGGSGQDTTAAVLAYLQANHNLRLANLFLIGEEDDPLAFWLTDHESSLVWSSHGTFQSSVIQRGSITSKVGLEVESLEVIWSPQNTALTTNMGTASAYQLARVGFFDNKRLRVWRCFLPTPGDANTLGATPIFGGFIGQVEPTRAAIHFNVNSYLYVINQKVPSQVIEVTNTLAGYTGGTPPRTFGVMPTFVVVAGSTTTQVNCNQVTPNAGNVPSGGVFDDGFMVFSTASSLAGQYGVIGNNGVYVDGNGNSHTAIFLFNPLPWAPNIGDTFYVSAQNPVNQADGTYYGFPYVPAAETSR